MSTLDSIHDIGGGGPLAGVSVRRVTRHDGTFMIHIVATSRIICGHGDTRQEAATALADQLREAARLIEAQEGSAR
jgi:hypothetical protein